jgi:hypothetical protein
LASNPNYVKKQLAVDTVSWTAVVASVDCMSVAIKNSVLVDLLIRTDATDAATQDKIPAGSNEVVQAPRNPHSTNSIDKTHRFEVGDTVGFLQAVSGTGPVVLTFVR